jgi:hypothetical protein
MAETSGLGSLRFYLVDVFELLTSISMSDRTACLLSAHAALQRTILQVPACPKGHHTLQHSVHVLHDVTGSLHPRSLLLQYYVNSTAMLPGE